MTLFENLLNDTDDMTQFHNELMEFDYIKAKNYQNQKYGGCKTMFKIIEKVILILRGLIPDHITIEKSISVDKLEVEFKFSNIKENFETSFKLSFSTVYELHETIGVEAIAKILESHYIKEYNKK